jgi:hypothetical protein
MSEPVVYRVLPADGRWMITRNEKHFSHYATCKIAWRAAARLGRREKKKGGSAIAYFYGLDRALRAKRHYGCAVDDPDR